MSPGASEEGVRSRGGVEWSHQTVTILHPDDWFKGEKSGEKRKAGEGEEVDRWCKEGPRPRLPSMIDGGCLEWGKKKKKHLIVILQRNKKERMAE